jgi:predicted nucleotidyltransferase
VVAVAGAVIDEARLADVCARYGIAELLVFGSVARGTARPGSDIDVLYTLREGRHLGWEIEDLAEELSEIFRRPVDLISRRSLHSMLRENVMAGAMPLYAA